MPKELLLDTFVSGMCPTFVKRIISNLLFIQSHNLMDLYIYSIMKNEYVNSYKIVQVEKKNKCKRNKVWERGSILY